MKALIIGGSAGAIDALKIILPGLPKERRDFAVIVVLHLLPRGQSLLPIIFRDRCPWPCKEAESTEKIVDGTVYFAPNDYHLSIEHDRSFALSNEEQINFSRPSIDLSFRSAAAVYKSELTAIVLSGANNDGSLGLAEVIRRGGEAIVQAPETAEFTAMPKAAMQVSSNVKLASPKAVVDFLNGRS